MNTPVHIEFENYQTADIIKKLITDKFRPYLTLNSGTGVTNFSLLPPLSLYDIPEEDRKTFVAVHDMFAEIVVRTAFLDVILEKYEHTDITQENVDNIENDLCNAFHKYERENSRNFVGEFFRYFDY